MTGQEHLRCGARVHRGVAGRKQFSPSFKLADRTAVYAIQNEVARASGPVAGWKVGARTPTAEPNCAPLLAGALVNSPAKIRRQGDAHDRRRDRDVVPYRAGISPRAARRSTATEALAAVGDAFVGMEVVDTRLADFKSADPEWLLADNQMNQALVVGDPIRDWRTLDWPNLQVKLVIDGKVEVDQTGGLGAVDPVRPLAWIIDHAVRQRGGIRKGQAITTGSWTGLRYYPPGTKARGEFVGLGTVEASF